jgi:hypothetical protein
LIPPSAQDDAQDFCGYPQKASVRAPYSHARYLFTSQVSVF